MKAYRITLDIETRNAMTPDALRTALDEALKRLMDDPRVYSIHQSPIQQTEAA